jgi:6-pyruvoyltetrahydropterin/6-carboxytetrahydropterin synthase
MLSKHPSLCRFPHGHSRKVEVVIRADRLDASDMVCDFKALKLALKPLLDRLDHAMLVNSKDPILSKLESVKERVIALEGVDPTTEVLAETIYRHLDAQLRSGTTFRDEHGHEYRFPSGLVLERVRVGETSSTWAEFTPA